MKAAMLATALLTVVVSSPLLAGTVSGLLEGYQGAGAGPFSATRGGELWQRPGTDSTRRCSTCHGIDLGQGGRHKRTGKPIAAMSPAVEPKRLSDAKKIEKWLRRNCKWTWGRTCTAQEKGDLLSYIQQNPGVSP